MPMQRAATYVLALLTGVAAALLVLPMETILGAGPGWEAPFRDQAQSLAGHLAFQADAWRWPLLRTETLFWTHGVSIALTDSSPLVSLAAKLWVTLTGRAPVNLLGVWLAACLVLQPVSAAYAARGLRLGLVPCVAAGVLAACWPALLFRMGHVNLCGHFLVLLGRYWHVVAIAYLTALLVVWFANPEEALPFMLSATLQSLIAVIVGVVIVSFIARFVSTGLNLPGDIKERLPLLEARLKAFVPTVMQVVRWVVIIGVLVAIAQAWALFDFAGWISTEEGQGVAGSVISAALIILVCLALYIAVSSWVEFRLNPNFGTVPTSREKTLLGLFRNAFTIALVVFGVMLALGQIGVNIAPLLAGAGVIGLAIGFGAQKLVQDIITGIFIQFENVMNEGDVVEAAGKTGVVEKLTIRSVTIRDLSGTVHLIPFSSVDQVSNMVRGFSFHVAELGVAYNSDIVAVKQAMFDAFDRLMESEHKDHILDNLEMHGVTAFGDSAITVRARIKTVPGEQWSTGRAYNECIKTVFEERGIEIPYPHVTYVQGGEARASGRVLLPSIDETGPNEGGTGCDRGAGLGAGWPICRRSAAQGDRVGKGPPPTMTEAQACPG